MNVRVAALRWLFYVFAALGILGNTQCSPGTPTIAVTVNGLGVAAIHQLAVTAQLAVAGGGATTQGPQTVVSPLNHFLVQLPAGWRGTVSLQVAGLDENGCQVATATSAVLPITADQQVQQSITLQRLAETGCRLVVQTVNAAGSVVLSMPAGISCSSPTCDSTFGVGQTVTLQAQASANATFIGWSGDCSGSGDCNVAIGAGTVRVSAFFAPLQLCSAGGFCWQQPQPQGYTLVSVWGSSGNDVWAVGSYGSILHYINTFWVPVSSGTQENLGGIWGSGPNDIWVVGEDGTVLHGDGATFSPVPAPTTAQLNGIWGTVGSAGTAELWIGGGNGVMLHWDGSALVVVPSGTTDVINQIWGSGAQDVWAVTTNPATLAGSILHYDGSAWKVVYTQAQDLLGVWGSAAGDVWFVGGSYTTGNSVVIHWQGTAFDSLSITTDDPLTAVCGTSAADVWAVGPYETNHRLSTSDSVPAIVVQPYLSSEITPLQGVWGDRPDDYWAVGRGGVLAHWNGSYWSPLTSGFLYTMSAIAAGGPDDVWAVASLGTILHFQGSFWTQIDTAGTAIAKPGEDSIALLGVLYRSQSDVWIVGQGGVVLRWLGSSTWDQTIQSGTQDDLNAVWGFVPGSPAQTGASQVSDVWAVGGADDTTDANNNVAPGHGTIIAWHWNGTGWVNAPPLTTSYFLKGVWGSAANDIYAVGGQYASSEMREHGSILHYDGVSWSSVSDDLPYIFCGVWGSGPNDVWAIGWQVIDPNNQVGGGSNHNSAIFHFDGQTWSERASLSGGQMLSIWGSGANDVWAGGNLLLGNVAHWDGTSWALVEAGGSGYAVGGSDKDHVWIAGQYGAILFRGLPADKPSFAPAVNSAIGGNPTVIEALAFVDLNGDGKLDVAAATGAGAVSVLLGDGQGGFTHSADFPAGKQPSSLAVADFNGDGKPDVAVANSADNDVSVLLGDGTGGFGPGVSSPVGLSPSSLAAGDFNQDGSPDLVVTNSGGTSLSVLLGKGNGAFAPAVSVALPTKPLVVTVADLNGDGKPDLAVTAVGATSGVVYTLLGNGKGGFTLTTTLVSAGSPAGVAAGDFNGDGAPDLALAGPGLSGVEIFLGDGKGGFGPLSTFPVSAVACAGPGPGTVALADFDGDGNLDVAVTDNGGNSVAVLLGDGRGNLGSPFNYPVGAAPSPIVAGQVHGAAHPDLVIGDTSGAYALSVLLNQAR